MKTIAAFVVLSFLILGATAQQLVFSDDFNEFNLGLWRVFPLDFGANQRVSCNILDHQSHLPCMDMLYSYIFALFCVICTA
jgi:hypothetical protein